MTNSIIVIGKPDMTPLSSVVTLLATMDSMDDVRQRVMNGFRMISSSSRPPKRPARPLPPTPEQIRQVIARRARRGEVRPAYMTSRKAFSRCA